LRYFGDEAETLAGCGRCDNCTALEAPGDADVADTAVVVRKALSAVARVHGRFGLVAAARLLAGEPDPRLERSGLARTRTFGALRGKSEAWLMALLRRCVAAGWVDFTSSERPVVLLTPAGRAVLFDEGPVRLLLPPEDEGRRRRSSLGEAQRRAAAVEPELDAAGQALFEALRSRRLELARRDAVPPYVVASDRTLRELAELRPQS